MLELVAVLLMARLKSLIAKPKRRVRSVMTRMVARAVPARNSPKPAPVLFAFTAIVMFTAAMFSATIFTASMLAGCKSNAMYDDNAGIFTNNVLKTSSDVADETAEAKPAASKPQKTPKPLAVDLTHGTRVARIDGVQIYLNRYATFDSKTQGAVPSAIDMKKTVEPLVNAHTNAIAATRPIRVFIDPGHGGADPGASSANGKHSESSHVLEIAKLTAKRLEKAGYEVMMSRYDNISTQTLFDRTTKANEWDADLFVSIHLNYNPSPDPAGAETYILTPAGEFSTMDDSTPKPGAANKGNGSVAHTGNTNDTGNAQLGFAIHRRLIGTTKMQDRGLRRARFAVLREAKMPAVLVECGFLTSERDLAFVTGSEGRKKIAQSLFEGICDYALGNLDANRIAYDSGKLLPAALAKAPKSGVSLDDNPFIIEARRKAKAASAAKAASEEKAAGAAK